MKQTELSGKGCDSCSFHADTFLLNCIYSDMTAGVPLQAQGLCIFRGNVIPQTHKKNLGHLLNIQIPRLCPRPSESESLGEKLGCSCPGKVRHPGSKVSTQTTSIFKRIGRAGSRWGEPFSSQLSRKLHRVEKGK